MKKVNIYKLSLLISILIFSGAMYYVCETNIYCGNIIKIVPETAIPGGRKSQGYIERLVIINFDVIGAKAINLEPVSYYSAKVNQNICVKLTKSDLNIESKFLFILLCLSGLCSIVFAMFVSDPSLKSLEK